MKVKEFNMIMKNKGVFAYVTNTKPYTARIYVYGSMEKKCNVKTYGDVTEKELASLVESQEFENFRTVHQEETVQYLIQLKAEEVRRQMRR